MAELERLGGGLELGAAHLGEERDVLHDRHVLVQVLRDRRRRRPVLRLPRRPLLGRQRRRRRRRRQVARRGGVDVVAGTDLALNVARQPQRPEREEGRPLLLRLLRRLPQACRLLLRVEDKESLGRLRLRACVERGVLNLRPAGSPKASTSARPCPSLLQAPAKPGPSSRWRPRARFSTKLGAVLASQTNHVHEGAGHRRGRRLVARDVRRPARTIPGGPEAAAATPSAVESSPGGPELGWGDLRLVSRHGALWAKSKGEEARRKPCEPPGHQLTPCEPTSAGRTTTSAVSFGGTVLGDKLARLVASSFVEPTARMPDLPRSSFLRSSLTLSPS